MVPQPGSPPRYRPAAEKDMADLYVKYMRACAADPTIGPFSLEWPILLPPIPSKRPKNLAKNPRKVKPEYREAARQERQERVRREAEEETLRLRQEYQQAFTAYQEKWRK